MVYWFWLVELLQKQCKMGVTGLRVSLARVLAVMTDLLLRVYPVKTALSCMILMEAPQNFFKYWLVCNQMPFTHKNLFQVRYWWWNCVTNGKMRSFSYTLFSEGLFHVLKIQCVLCIKFSWITPMLKFFYFLSKKFFWRACSQKS